LKYFENTKYIIKKKNQRKCKKVTGKSPHKCKTVTGKKNPRNWQLSCVSPRKCKLFFQHKL